MRVRSRKFGENLEADMTPMIDMTFQLIAFFMVLVNFSQAEQDARVQLPASKLAKPPEQESKEDLLTIQLAKVDKDYLALIGGDEIPVGKPLDGILGRERRQFGAQGKQPRNVVVIIRAHENAPTGMVQEIIELCQKHQFERFRLRVKEELN